MGWQLLPPRIKEEREGMGMVPPRIPFQRRETQLKEEHPQQEEWDRVDLWARFRIQGLMAEASDEERYRIHYALVECLEQTAQGESLPHCRYLEQKEGHPMPLIPRVNPAIISVEYR